MIINKLAIIGTGVMGMGIAQIAAQAGVQVYLFDTKADAADKGKQSLTTTLDKLTAKGKISEDERQATLERLTIVNELQDIQNVDAVIEAIIENLEIKQQLFTQLESIVAPTTIIATNTSSLSVTAIASNCQNPERVAGFHFFNPVPLMKIVEVIPGLSTDKDIVESLLELAKRMGHLGVVAKDTPGFIVNHAGRAYGTEALKILGEGVSDFESIDTILREGAGFRMGAFELMDLTGIDVSHPVMESIYQQFYQEDRYRPHPLTRQMLLGKKLGRKVGGGFYQYSDGVKQTPTHQQTRPIREIKPSKVWIAADLDEDKQALTTFLKDSNVMLDTGEAPASDSLVLLAIYGEDTTTAALRLGVNPQQAVAIDMLTDINKHRTLMPSIVTNAQVIEQAYALFARGKGDQLQATIINESVGFVAQRVLAMVINLGCDIAQQQIATPKDIDNAVKLGLGYPFGPISWGEKLGTKKILLILERMVALTHDPRYRPSPWLQRRAKLGVSLFTQQQLSP